MAACPMAPTVHGDPPGEVTGLSFFFPIGDHSYVVFVGGASAAGMARLLEVVHFGLQVFEFSLGVRHGRL